MLLTQYVLHANSDDRNSILSKQFSLCFVELFGIVMRKHYKPEKGAMKNKHLS